MLIDKKTFFIIGEAVVIVVLIILLTSRIQRTDIDSSYLTQLQLQNQELGNQLNRLKQNYRDIGLVDSIQSRTTDSLIVASGRRMDALRTAVRSYRVALEEMKGRGWKRLTEAQKAEEVEKALSYLKQYESQD